MRTFPALALLLASLASTACTVSIERGLAASSSGPADVPWSKGFDGAIVGGLTGDDSVLAATWTGQDPGHLRRFDPAGNPVWDESVGNIRDLGVSPDGSTFLAFDLDGAGPATILGQAVSCSSGCAGVARLGADGRPVWVKTFGNQAWANIDNLRVAANGRIAMTGTFQGTLDLGTGPLSPDGKAITLFVAELTQDGVTAWSRAVHFFYPPSATFFGWAVLDMAVSPTGDVLISGRTDAPVDYGAGMVPAGYGSSFFARYDAAGNVIHGAVLPADVARPIHVALDGAGRAVLAAWIDGTFDLGGGVTGTPGEDQLYLVMLDPNGHLLSSKSIVDTFDVLSYPVLAVDGEDDAWLCGTSSAAATVAGVPVQPVSMKDVLLLKLDPAGNLVDERQYGTSGSFGCDGIRIGPTGVPVISGGMSGSIDFGQGPLPSDAQSGAFIAKLGPGGP